MAAPTDRVQLRKNESAAGGGDAADDDLGFPALLDPNEDAPEMQGWFLQPPSPSTSRDEEVYARRDSSGNLVLRDAVGGTEYDLETLAAGSAGMTQAQHKVLRQLIHFLDDGPAEGFTSGAYKETLGGVFPTSEIWYESSAKSNKIVELTMTWSGVKIAQEVWKLYDTDGSTVLWTITDAILYSGVFETSRTRTIA